MLICLDTETTGLYAGPDEMLELAIVDGDKKILFHEYLKPTKKTEWTDAQRVNNISPEMVANAKPFSEYREQIQEIYNAADRVVGYNLGFDLSFLEAAGIDLKIEGDRTQEWYDVMEEFAPIYSEGRYHGGYKWQKLIVCAGYFGYKWEGNAHGALADTLATLFCYNKLQSLEEDAAAQKALLDAEPDPVKRRIMEITQEIELFHRKYQYKSRRDIDMGEDMKIFSLENELKRLTGGGENENTA